MYESHRTETPNWNDEIFVVKNLDIHHHEHM